jgi:poly(3-hydroxybutyrate) depolymerase
VRSRHRSASPRVAAALGLALGLALVPLGFVACSTPSSTIDGGDLLGVFSKDGGSADAAADARPGKDGGKREAKNALVLPGPTRERKPVTGTCVAKQGEADHELRRTLGRPACRDEQILEGRDADGSPRYACVMARGADTRAPLPLIVLFHGPEGTPAQVDKHSNWKKLAAKFDMTGDPAHAGFVVLMPQGRLLKRDRSGAIFDTDFIGDGNVDVDTVDAFVAQLTKRGLVDARRVYAVGESKGGRMAATWAMLRADKVAAFAAYGSDAPSAAWTCADVQPPPALLLYRACDAVAPCDAVEDWIHAREKAQTETVAIRLGDGNQEELHCAMKNKCPKTKGTANHERWPKGREEDILRFLAKHALSADATPAPAADPAVDPSTEPSTPDAPAPSATP